MAKFSHKLFHGKDPLLRQMIYQIQYADGYLYLDRCGLILNRITRNEPVWIKTEANPQTALLHNVAHPFKFNFSSTSLGLEADRTQRDGGSIDDEERATFVESCHRLTGWVIDELGITEVTRIGTRCMYFFSMASKDECVQWADSLGWFRCSDKLAEVFGNRQEANHTMVFVGETARYRVRLATVERPMQFSVGGDTVTVREGGTSRGFRKEAHKILERERAKKNQEADSPQAVVIDVDVYHEDPPSIDVKDFMITHTSNLLELLRGTITQSQQVNQ